LRRSLVLSPVKASRRKGTSDTEVVREPLSPDDELARCASEATKLIAKVKEIA
jgi:hypothetical protein